jgi:hypothetical protein
MGDGTLLPHKPCNYEAEEMQVPLMPHINSQHFWYGRHQQQNEPQYFKHFRPQASALLLRIFNIYTSFFTICPRCDNGTTIKHGTLPSVTNKEREEEKTEVRKEREGKKFK